MHLYMISSLLNGSSSLCVVQQLCLCRLATYPPCVRCVAVFSSSLFNFSSGKKKAGSGDGHLAFLPTPIHHPTRHAQRLLLPSCISFKRLYTNETRPKGRTARKLKRVAEIGGRPSCVFCVARVDVLLLASFAPIFGVFACFPFSLLFQSLVCLCT